MTLLEAAKKLTTMKRTAYAQTIGEPKSWRRFYVDHVDQLRGPILEHSGTYIALSDLERTDWEVIEP